MRLTCIVCTVNLILLAVAGGLYAFTGLNVLYLIFFNNATAVGCFLAVCFISAMFEIYALIALKPFKGLR